MSDEFHALTRQAVAFVRDRRLNEALETFQEAARLEPNNAEGVANLANVLLLLGRYNEALLQAQRAADLDPSLARPFVIQGAVYLRQGRFDDALDASRRALRLDPTLREARYHEAMACVKLDRVVEGAALAKKELAGQPPHLAMHYVLGIAAMKENRLADALVHYETLLHANPKDAQAHLNRALIWLLSGDFERGWPEYEWRWQGHGFVTRPMWDGKRLDGKTIMLHAEQGLGDALQFIRYAPLVKERGGTVVFACPERLHPLLSRSPGIDQLASSATFAAPADEHALLLSLPAIFGTKLATIPVTTPYIFADPELVRIWRQELSWSEGCKIGIAWQASPTHPDNRARSIPLAEFAPLAEVEGVRLISLQKKDGTDQLATAPFRVVNLGARLDEANGAFMDTAAVMMSLDLVITSDSAIAHLAGALGVPVWVALTFAPDFRWLLDREDSPWYPTMRLFRQTKRGEWAEVFERMARRLVVRNV